MRSHEIESWALNVVDRVQKRQPVEDSRVECKRDWPSDTKKAARRIAGHANSAHGEPILWLVGVDEKKGLVPGAELIEFDSWFKSVSASFDELAPAVKSLNIPVPNGTVVALHFETDRAPYVVKVADGGSVQREVPWRVGTGVRTATRSQLIKLLSPLTQRPSFEVVGSILRTDKTWGGPKNNEYIPFEVFVALFVTQPVEQEIVIPSHRCSISIELSNFARFGPFEGKVDFKNAGWQNVNATPSGISVKGSALFEVRQTLHLDFTPEIEKSFLNDARLDLILSPSNLDNSIEIIIPLKVPTNGTVDVTRGRWINGDYRDYWGLV